MKWYLIYQLLHSVSVLVNGNYLWLLLNLLDLSWSRLNILIYFCLNISFLCDAFFHSDFINMLVFFYLDFPCIL